MKDCALKMVRQSYVESATTSFTTSTKSVIVRHCPFIGTGKSHDQHTQHLQEAARDRICMKVT